MRNNNDDAAPITRRQVLKAVAGGALLPWVVPVLAQAKESVEAIVPVLKDFTRGAPVRVGKVKLDIPPLAENGNLVPASVAVDSPMTASDHVKMLYLLSEKNPRPVIAKVMFGLHAGRAGFVTRIRLAGAQRVVAVAEMSDGSFWADVVDVVVTETACTDGT